MLIKYLIDFPMRNLQYPWDYSMLDVSAVVSKLVVLLLELPPSLYIYIYIAIDI